MSERIDESPESRRETLTRLGSRIVQTAFKHGRNISSRYDNLHIVFANAYPEVRVSYQEHLDNLKDRIDKAKEKLKLQRDPVELHRTLEFFLEYRRWQAIAQKADLMLSQSVKLTAVRQSFEAGIVKGKKEITSVGGMFYRLESGDAGTEIEAIEEIDFDDLHLSVSELDELSVGLEVFGDQSGPNQIDPLQTG